MARSSSSTSRFRRNSSSVHSFWQMFFSRNPMCALASHTTCRCTAGDCEDKCGEARPGYDEGGYEVSAPTATSDRVCAGGTVRSGDQYQTRGPFITASSQDDSLSLPGEVAKSK